MSLIITFYSLILFKPLSASKYLIFLQYINHPPAFNTYSFLSAFLCFHISSFFQLGCYTIYYITQLHMNGHIIIVAGAIKDCCLDQSQYVDKSYHIDFFFFVTQNTVYMLKQSCNNTHCHMSFKILFLLRNICCTD